MRGVLFDLDGTLLDVNVNEFLSRYFRALDTTISPQFPGVELVPAILGATDAMHRPHPDLTNREVFDRDFFERTGIDVEQHWAAFESFYRIVFPGLGKDYGPAKGARAAIDAARAAGWRVAVATQPIFPMAAIRQRLKWARLDDVEFDAITTYEVMRACKPASEYFAQTCEMIGCAPSECVMVGDDASADMPAAKLGLTTYYVGRGAASADFCGPLSDFPAWVERIAAR